MPRTATSFASPLFLPKAEGDASLDLACWEFIKKVVERFGVRYANTSVVQLFQVEYMSCLTKRFLECQHSFRQARKPIHVDVAFHYTSSKNLSSIRRAGLLSTKKQKHGASFGQGIYVCANPHAFSCYGDVGIVLLCLKGTVKQMERYGSTGSFVDSSVDSFRGNKLMIKTGCGTEFPTSEYFDEVILRKSEQALPLATFDQNVTNNAELLYDLQCFFQSAADCFLNQGYAPTPVRRVYPSLDDISYEHGLRDRFQNKRKGNATALAGLFNVATKKTKTSSKVEVVACLGPTMRTGSKHKLYKIVQRPPTSGVCPICMDSLCQHGPAVRLCKCNHSFHQKCLENVFQLSSHKCPVCRTVVGEPYGMCPVGTLTIQSNPFLHCAGHEKHGTLVLTYSIPSGFQSAPHPAPGQGYEGFSERVAYLPNNKEGRDLLKRLRYAFSHGLCFSVGTSLTTGKPNRVVWASIHHKTSTGRSAHGWPDLGYFINCNEELDAAGVPKAQDL